MSAFVKAKIIESGWKIRDVVAEMNKRGWRGTPSNFSQKLSNGTLRYSEAEMIADIIGKKIIWEEK